MYTYIHHKRMYVGLQSCICMCSYSRHSQYHMSIKISSHIWLEMFHLWAVNMRPSIPKHCKDIWIDRHTFIYFRFFNYTRSTPTPLIIAIIIIGGIKWHIIYELLLQCRAEQWLLRITGWRKQRFITCMCGRERLQSFCSFFKLINNLTHNIRRQHKIILP